ncbi:hypothetical protein [Hydrocarboniphaga sp.]|uniref:hypothetical protein n=1 Tax=Hydrocarboniphaga sp. TaxID=2033016 RepID=UPI003D11D57D
MNHSEAASIQLSTLGLRRSHSPAFKTAEELREERRERMRRLPFREQQIVNLQLLIASAAASAILIGAAALLAAPLAIRRLSLWLSA